MSRHFNDFSITGNDLDNYDYLQHFGIFGMKWGIRRYQKSNGSLTPEGKLRKNSKISNNKPISKKDSAKLTSKSFEDMSDEEINKAFQRLNAERNIKNLAKQDAADYAKEHPGSFERAKKIVEQASVLSTYTGTISTGIYKTMAGIHGIEKLIDSEDSSSSQVDKQYQDKAKEIVNKNLV